MYKYLLESVDQINWLAIGPLLMFFVFFCGIVIRTFTLKKTHTDQMAQMPLQDND